MNAIEQSYMGEVTNDNTELGLLGTKIGTTLKEQEKTGLMGNSSLITNFALIKQGLTDGLRGNAVIMSQTESQEYLQKEFMKIESTKKKIKNNRAIKSENVDVTRIEKTTKDENMIIGNKRFGTHWIEPYGNASIKKVGDELIISGKQNDGKDFCSIEGKIKIIDERNFEFNGNISLVYNYTDYKTSQPRVEKKTLSGTQIFRRFGNRPYWRLKQPDTNGGYFESCYHYIDIFMN